MITEHELKYIAENWLPHQYLHPSFWGESLKKATPEAYLSMYRGVEFKQLKTKIVPIIKHYDLFNFNDIYLSWIEKCGYHFQTFYEHDIENRHEMLKERIVNLLSPYVIAKDRIYTLE